MENDVKLAAGPLQTCAGHEAGCEAAIHAMKEIEALKGTEAILLLDATNAFNTINRQAALHNIKVICPVPAITPIPNQLDCSLVVEEKSRLWKELHKVTH